MSHHDSKVLDQSLFTLTWPIFVELLLIMMVGIADAWFLSRISDETAAGVGTVLTIIELGIMIFIALSQACNSVCSQRLGAKDSALVGPSFAMTLILFTIVGGIFSLFFIAFASPLSTILGLKGSLHQEAVIYLAVTGGGIVILAWKFALNTVTSALGHTAWNMWATAAMNLCNIGLNYGFLHGIGGLPKLDVFGIALASVISWFVSVAILYLMIRFGLKISLPIKEAMKNFRALAKPMLDIAIPGTAEPVSYQFSQIVMAYWVVRMGEMAMATRVYVINILFVSALWGFALATGLQIKVSHLLGANRVDEAYYLVFQVLKVAIAGAMAIIFVTWYFGQGIMELFTTNPEIIDLGTQIFALGFAIELGRMMNLIVGTNLRAAGDARYVAIMATAVIWGIGVPMSYLLGFSMELALIGVFIAIALDELTRGGACLYRWVSKQWCNKSLYSGQLA